jgi:hypothetical protein
MISFAATIHLSMVAITIGFVGTVYWAFSPSQSIMWMIRVAINYVLVMSFLSIMSLLCVLGAIAAGKFVIPH